MRWWLERGVDGFRMDVINMISKVPGLPDAPVTRPGPCQWAGQYFLHGPRLLEFLREIKTEVLSRYDLFTVGEMPGVTTEHAVDLTHEETGALNMLFQFEHVGLGHEYGEGGLGKWSRSRGSLLELKRIMTRWQKELEGRGWNAFYLSNHDQPRAVSRFGDDGESRVESAKMLATFLLCLHGTPYIYQGDEIAMTNAPFDSIDEYRDIETLNFYHAMMEAGGRSREEIMAAIRAKSRDNARTPVQWSAEPYAGFTTGTPWIGVHPNHREVNVARSLVDPDSVLSYYRRLIRLRRASPVLIHGRYDLLLEAHEQVFAFTRTLASDRVLVLLNFTADTPVAALPSHLEPWSSAELLIANYPQVEGEDIGVLTLRPWEARVYRLHPVSDGR
jgi:oligo-1,6-glucosidase